MHYAAQKDGTNSESIQQFGKPIFTAVEAMIFAPCCCNSYETFLNWFPYFLICTPFQPSLILQKCMTYIYIYMYIYIYWCYHPCYHPEICMTCIHIHTHIYIYINTYCIYIGLKLQSSTPNCRVSGHPSALRHDLPAPAILEGIHNRSRSFLAWTDGW